MALSNSQYDAIIREYGRQQLQNKHEQDKRVEEIYRRIPAVKELDDAISTTAVEAAKKVLGGDPNALEQMRADLADLREQKEILLKAKGYPPDYMEMKYRCPDCRDTGYVGQPVKRFCKCFERRMMSLAYENANMAGLEQQCFENFARITPKGFRIMSSATCFCLAPAGWARPIC